MKGKTTAPTDWTETGRGQHVWMVTIAPSGGRHTPKEINIPIPQQGDSIAGYLELLLQLNLYHLHDRAPQLILAVLHDVSGCLHARMDTHIHITYTHEVCDKPPCEMTSIARANCGNNAPLVLGD